MPLNTTIESIDSSTIAAFAALMVSIIGTIIGPIVTTMLTNRHQLKLRKLDIRQKNIEAYEERRFLAINTFIAKAGKCLAFQNVESVTEFGEAFHCIYQYVPTNLWNDLDEFYADITAQYWVNARIKYPPITHKLAEILKETPQLPR